MSILYMLVFSRVPFLALFYLFPIYIVNYTFYSNASQVPLSSPVYSFELKTYIQLSPGHLDMGGPETPHINT